MKLRNLIEEYLEKAILLQVATSANDQPWVCTVHFTFDVELNLYWMSLPERRHSLEIKSNPKIAGVIVHPHKITDVSRGIQLQGMAHEIVDTEELETTFPYYGKRFNCMGSLPRLINGKNKHRLYRLKPSLYVLFDEVNFLNNPRQEYRM